MHTIYIKYRFLLKKKNQKLRECVIEWNIDDSSHIFIVSLVSMYAISDEVYFRKVIQRVRVYIFQYIKYSIFI